MNQHDPLEQRLIRTFNHVANTASFDDDWIRIRSDLDDGSPDRGRRWRAVAAVGVMAVLSAVGVVVWSTKDTGVAGSLACDLPPVEELRQLVPEEPQGPVDGVMLAGESVIDSDPLVVAGAVGPAPRFNTSGLGEQFEFEPIGALSPSEDAFVFGPTATESLLYGGGEVKRTVLGRIGGDIWLTRVVDSAEYGSDGQVQRRRSIEVAGEPSGSVQQPADPTSLDLISVPSFHQEPDWTRPQWSGSVAFTGGSPGSANSGDSGSFYWDGVLPEAAVVTLESGDIRAWTRPVGGVAVFPTAELPDQHYRFRQYSIDGVEIACAAFRSTPPANLDEISDRVVDLAAIPTHTIDGVSQPLSNVVDGRRVMIVVATSNSASAGDDQGQIDQLATIAKVAEETGVPIIVVAAFDRTPDVLQERVSEAGLTDPVVVLDNDSDASLLEVGYLPSIVLIDANSEVKEVITEPPTERELIGAIERAFD